MEIAHILKQYDKKYHRLLEDSLDWLDEHESKWNLEEPMDKFEFIKAILERATFGK